MRTDRQWEILAKGLVRAEMARRQVSTRELVQRLEAIGIRETESNVTTKIGRGTFSVVFLLQVLEALGVKNLPIDSGD
jgi:hypothetical protein